MSRSLILLLALLAAPVLAEPVRIGSITIEADDVYPAVDGVQPEFPYSVANALHMRTRPEVIRRELLFQEGDVFQPALLEETERNLRRFAFLRRVRVEASEPVDGVVHVQVSTVDSWTTKLQVNLGSSGGKLTGSGGLVEDNLLGLGKSLSAFYIVDSERTSTRLAYLDPRLLGKFVTLGVAYNWGDELRRIQMSLFRPFVSTQTRWSWGLYFDERDVEEYLYEFGEESLRFHQERLRLEGFVARSLTTSPTFVNRVRVGWRHAEDEFSEANLQNPLPEDFQNGDRLFSGPYVGWELRRIQFIRETGINTYGRDEDFNLGAALNVEAGFYPEAFGSRHSAIALGAVATKGLAFGPGRFALGTARASSRFHDDGMRNGSAQLRLDYYHRLSTRLTLAFSTQADWLKNPDPEMQFVLGGEQGLRGYKLRLFTGNKGTLSRIEGRILLIDDLLQLCSIGTVAFFDAGNAWKEGQPIDLLDQSLDVGGGLRFTFPRSSTGQILRLDLSYALDDNGFDSPWLFSFGSTQSF